MRLRFAVCLVGTATVVLSAGIASAQDAPTKPITIYAPPAGGPLDFEARLIGQGISGPLGQPVVIVNRASNLLGEVVAKAPPDGSTLMLNGGNLWVQALLRSATAYDPVKDFSPITLISTAPSIIVVHPSLPVKSVKELIALARARPRELNYAAEGVGGASHLGAELFKSMARVNIVQINYKGAGAGLNGLVSGEADMMFCTAAAAVPYIKAGKMRALAVTSARPSLLFPDLPTAAATGLPGYESLAIQGMFAPAKTPTAIINRLNREIIQVLSKPDVKERMFNAGLETVWSTPEGLANTIKADMAQWGKVIKEANIHVE